VDDDKNILSSLRKVFESEGYIVDTAETGREAVEKSEAGFYNLALLDIKLPDMNGTELLESLPKMVKIMVTGYPELENAIESVNMGADAYFVKPVDPRRLLRVVEGKLKEQEEAEKISLERVKKWIRTHVEKNSDITMREKSEEEMKDLIEILDSYNRLLQESNKSLEQANADLENYAYAISHDLKAPLRAIISFSTFLLEDYSSKIDATGRDYLERVVKAAENMNAFIGDLLLLSRIGRKYDTVEKVDLNNLLCEIIKDLEPLIEKRDTHVVVTDLPTIHVQKTWIKQLFTNLIDNGLKFNKSESPKVEVQCNEKEKDYLFAVRDNGIGIEEQYLNRIFNLFERLHAKEEYEGTGAGLAICKKIIDNFGGKIWVESTPGEGSTFFFTIPKKGLTNGEDRDERNITAMSDTPSRR